MTPFHVLSPGGFISEQGSEIAIQAFSRLYHSITPKHQRQIHLILVDEKKAIQRLNHKINTSGIGKAVRFIERENTDEVVAAYEEASVFLFPASNSLHRIIPEALSYGLPVITIEHEEMKAYIDATCGMLVRKLAFDQTIAEFTNMMKMLYFDPEVRKILKKGAKTKYLNHFSWGRTESIEKIRN